MSRLLKVSELRRYYAERRVEFWLSLATLVGVVAIDVLPGPVIGILAMLLLVIHRASRPHLGELGRVPGVPGAYGDVGRHPECAPIPHLLVLRLEAPLFYANASLVRDRIKLLVGASDPPPVAVVLDAGANPGLDITSTEMLEQLVQSLREAGVDFALADVRQPVADMMRRSGLLETLGRDRVYRTIDEAVRALS